MPVTPTAPVPQRRATRTRAFTLVEIMIVLVILGILAAIVIPQFTSATAEARNNSIQMDLNRIRTQIEIYTSQHNSVPPSVANFADQLTKASKATGETADVGTAGYPLGPYLREIPVNPNSGLNTVGTGAVGTSGWFYNETTGDFRANDSDLSLTY